MSEVIEMWHRGESPAQFRKQYEEYERENLREQLEDNCTIYDIVDGQIKQVEIDEIMPRVKS